MVMQRVVIVGTEGQLGKSLSALYRDRGHSVVELAVTADSAPGSLAAAAGDAPIDVLVFADDLSPATGSVASLSRTELAAGFDRLAMLPFRTAALLRPTLSGASGSKVVLLSRLSATMEAPDPNGRYRDRPFRAAAHALWRCFSVEWRAHGLIAAAIALPESLEDGMLSGLPEVIGAMTNGEKPMDLLDIEGRPIGW
jgi:NAD(P)-dependent dehydrogenase (short-subunit alcohol dehydrogenase family)